MRGKSLISVLLVLTLAVSLAMVNIGYGADSPNVYVAPSTVVSNPTQHVEIRINVTNAPNITGFQFNLRYDKKVLGFPPGPPYPGDNTLCNVTDGTFVSSAGPAEFKVSPNFLESWVHVGCHLTDAVATPPSGNGTLAIFRFYVVESGVSNLTLFGVKLFEYYTGSEVPGVTTQNGYFYTTKPFVDFDWTPAVPEVNEVTTFNASACWDPDGGNLTQFSWNFGDSNITVIGDDEPLTPIITHKYSGYNDSGWQVTLTVTDDESDTWSKTKTLRMWHELVSVNLWPAICLPYDYWFMDTVDRKIIRGEWLWILGTIVNTGTYEEVTNVTMTARHVATDTTVDLGWLFYENETATPWSETKAMLSLGTGTAGGSGWDMMFHWFTDDALPGVWELKLAATSVTGEVNTANNNLTLTVEILPYGELSESLNEWVSRPPSLTGKITLQDVTIAALAFGSTSGDPNYNPLADFNGDDKVNIIDLVHVGVAFDTEWN